MKTNTGNESLENFSGWDDQGQEQDFFGMLETASPEEVIVEETEVVETPTDEVEETAEEKKDKPAEKDFFSMSETEQSTETEEEEEEEQEQGKTGSIGTANFLKEKGLIEFELEEDEELTEEKASEIIEDKFEEAIELRMKELFEELPSEVKALNNYIIKGGSFNQYLATVMQSQNVGISADIDLTEESNQELVIRQMLKSEEYDQDYIDTQIEFLKDSGKLEAFSKAQFTKWKKDNEAVQTQLAKSQADAALKEKERIRKEKKQDSAFLTENDAIGFLTFSKEDKKQLPSYMNDKTVKLQNGATITQFQKELFYDLTESKEAMIQLAVLMRNRNEDGTFNFESVAKNTKTKVTKEVKENVRRSKSTPNKSGNNSPAKPRSLASYFSEE